MKVVNSSLCQNNCESMQNVKVLDLNGCAYLKSLLKEEGNLKQLIFFNLYEFVYLKSLIKMLKIRNQLIHLNLGPCCEEIKEVAQARFSWGPKGSHWNCKSTQRCFFNLSCSRTLLCGSILLIMILGYFNATLLIFS